MKLVLDASMTLAWIFKRTKIEETNCADQALSAIKQSIALVPSLWHTEIANALLVGERRNIITEAQIIDYLNRLSRLPIITDDTSVANRRDQVIALAREHKLSAYDATYLDLALRMNAQLATFDAKLAEAMRRAGGKIFGDD